MKFSYNWLKDFLPNIPKPTKVVELLNMHAFEVEDIKKLGKNVVFDIDILPNRMADAASHLGIAREIARILGKRSINLPRIVIRESKQNAPDAIRIKIENPKACRRYSARVVRGIKVGPSPQWLKERLRSVGVGSINNIVDATNYVMLEYGQPLHAFDFDKVDGGIVVRFAKKGEKILTLDGEDRELAPEVLVIADRTKPLAIAGIKGGAAAGITNKTRNILIESANFDPAAVYRASRLLGIRSDASKRFEAGQPAEATLPALERVTALIEQLAGGEAFRGVVDAGDRSGPKRAILLESEYAGKLLGVSLSLPRIKAYLLALDCMWRPGPKGALRVVPPYNRLDLEHPEDIIEEIGRLHGFERIPAHHPHALLLPSHAPDMEQLSDLMRDQLARVGFWEQENYIFSGEKMLRALGMDPEQCIAVHNPLSEDFRYLRTSLLPRLFKNIADNRGHAGDLSFFEIGRIFSRSQNRIVENDALGLVVSAKTTKDPAALLPHKQSPAFFELKGALTQMLNSVGIGQVQFEAFDPALQHRYPFVEPGRAARVLSGGAILGIIGNVAGVGSVACAELYLGEVLRVASEEHEYRGLPKYPEALRDIAVLVPKDVYTDDVAQEILDAGKPLVRDVDLFDYYEGENVPGELKNLAFHIYYQAQNRTLTDEEVHAVHQKITQALAAREWQVR